MTRFNEDSLDFVDNEQVQTCANDDFFEVAFLPSALDFTKIKVGANLVGSETFHAVVMLKD